MEVSTWQGKPHWSPDCCLCWISKEGKYLRDHLWKAGLWEGDLWLIPNLHKSQSVKSIKKTICKTTLYCYQYKVIHVQSDSEAETHVSNSFLATNPVDKNTGLRPRRKGRGQGAGYLFLLLMPVAGRLHTVRNGSQSFVKQDLQTPRFHPKHKWQRKSKCFWSKKWALKC